jgi:hypothetical protein
MLFRTEVTAAQTVVMFVAVNDGPFRAAPDTGVNMQSWERDLSALEGEDDGASREQKREGNGGEIRQKPSPATRRR